jgi:hypothetical protein
MWAIIAKEKCYLRNLNWGVTFLRCSFTQNSPLLIKKTVVGIAFVFQSFRYESGNIQWCRKNLPSKTLLLQREPIGRGDGLWPLPPPSTPCFPSSFPFSDFAVFYLFLVVLLVCFSDLRLNCLHHHQLGLSPPSPASSPFPLPLSLMEWDSHTSNGWQI